MWVIHVSRGEEGGPLAVGRNVAICCHWVAMRDQGWNTEKPQKINKMAHDKSLIVISILYPHHLTGTKPLNKTRLPKFVSYLITFKSLHIYFYIRVVYITWIVYCIISLRLQLLDFLVDVCLITTDVRSRIWWKYIIFRSSCSRLSMKSPDMIQFRNKIFSW